MSFRALRVLPSASRLTASRTAFAPVRVRALTAGVAVRSAAACASRAKLGAVNETGSRAFGTSASRFGEGASDVALAQKLAEELKYEEEGAKAEGEVTAGEPEFLKAFREKGVWEIQDTPGNDEVALVRQFGKETIRLIFSISDLAREEEDVDVEEGAATGEDGDNAGAETYAVRTSFTITKSTAPGSLNIDTVCQDGAFAVDALAFYADARVGVELTAEADWRRRGLYIGPQFDTLDVGVQEEFERFLQERGIDEALALFIPEYAEFKEQKEYVRWLENVKKFIEL